MLRSLKTNVFIRSFSTTPKCIVGANQIIPNIEKELRVKNDKGCIEYIFTKPAWSKLFEWTGYGSHSAQNPYGHAGVRYFIEGKDTVMNIAKDPVINFFPTSEYLFSDSQPPGDGQGGIFKRSFISVRIENVEQQKIRELHDYFQNLKEREDKKEIKYGLFLYVFREAVRRWVGKPPSDPELGNCSYWTGKGLTKIGLINHTSSWPLFLMFKLLFSQMEWNDVHKNVNIIAYRSIKHHEEPKGSLIYPFYWIWNSYRSFWNLDSLANIIVEPSLDGEEYSVKITKQPHVKDQWHKIKKQLDKVVRIE